MVLVNSDKPKRRYVAHHQTPRFDGPPGDRLQEQCKLLLIKIKRTQVK